MQWVIIVLAALLLVYIFPTAILFFMNFIAKSWQRTESCFWPFAGVAFGVSLIAIGIEFLLDSEWGLGTALNGFLVIVAGGGVMWFFGQKLRKMRVL